jgi:hypothetical protein
MRTTSKSNPRTITSRTGLPIHITYDSLDRVEQLAAPEGNVDLLYGAGRAVRPSRPRRWD